MRTGLRYLAGLVVMTAGLASVPAATGFGASNDVRITAAAFHPSTITVAVGDTVRWYNDDARHNHQVVADDNSFHSPLLKFGQQWTRVFHQPGSIGYHDGASPMHKGVVVVSGNSPSLTISLTTTAGQVIYGQSVTLSGAVSSHSAGESVQLTQLPYGQAGPSVLATAVTGNNGEFSFMTRPTILTNYYANWHGVSMMATVQVAPRLAFSRGSRYWYVRVYAGRPMTGRVVLIQRYSAYGQWVTIHRALLGSLSGARFGLALPKGTSQLRATISVNQAGAGYLAGFSRTLLVAR